MSSRPLERLPTIRAKLGSTIIFAVGMTVILIFLMLGYALRKSSQDTDRLTLLRVARRVAAGTLDERSRRRSPCSAPRPTARSLMSGQDAPALPVFTDGMVHVGSTGELEYAVVPVVRSGEVVELVYAVQQAPGEGLLARITETFRFLTDFWWQFLLAGALAAGIALVVARWLARGMTQPLRDMAAAARQMETGDYSQRVHTRSRDEVGQLADGVQPDERRAAGPRAISPRPGRERVPRAQDADHRDPRAPREPAGRRGAARSRRRCR